jgi:hypothetical protein
MAAGLRCGVWARAQSPTTSLSLVKGWARLSQADRGNLGIAMQDLAWTQATARGLPEPALFVMHPILHNLPNKLVHFLLDYHPDWVSRLQLPASDGRHRQLATADFHSALERLVDIPDVSCPLQLFSSVTIGHRDWRGKQCIHATPFEKETPTLVRCHICIYCDCICVYLLVSVYMMHVSAIYLYVLFLYR